MVYTLGDIGNAPGQAYDFLKRKYISLTEPDKDGDYSSRKSGIARQEKLAEMLSQMGAQEQAVSTAGGITAPMSGMGALARGLTSFGGSYLSAKAERDAAALDKASRAEAAAAGKALYTMPGTKGQLRISDEDPGTTAAPMEMNMPTLPGQEPSGEKVQYTLNMPNIPGREMGGGARPYEDQQRMLDKLDMSDNPYVAKMATVARGRIEAENLYKRGRTDTAADLADKRAYDDNIMNAALRLEAERFAIEQTQQATKDAESARRFMLTQAANAAGRVPTMRFVTVIGSDGKPKRVMMSDAEIVSAQAVGEKVSDTAVKALPHLTSQQFMNLGQSLTADINSANRLNRYMSDAKDIPQGFKLIAQDFANKFTTAFGKTLTGDALKVGMQQGTLQSLIGNLRIETVGGGVMTEQDALRVIQALGGDLGMLRNKDVVEGQIRKILESKEARIKQNMQFYNRDAENQGVSQMVYGSPSAGGGGVTPAAAAAELARRNAAKGQ